MMNNEKTKIIAVIPAHLNSIRFPKKILHTFHNLPMVEHVRRRALLCNKISDVLVATCDKEIADEVSQYGGKVVMTSDQHLTGTTRVAEAIHGIDCSHVLILQGDEPLLLPMHLDCIASSILKNPTVEAWNLTGPIIFRYELNKHSFVKCAVSEKNHILFCFRRSPSFSLIKEQQSFIRKILGVIAFRRSALIEIANLKATQIEKTEFIEQMRIIENGFSFQSVSVPQSTASVNEPSDVDIVLKKLKEDPDQEVVLKKIIHY